MTRHTPDDHPLARVEWVDRATLRANDYNPNAMASPERHLLRQSILEDGWTQPIVARSDGEIVDGFHRWLTSADPDIAALTGGLVPVVRLDTDPATQRMATIRHNRARGTHGVVRMTEIVRDLAETHDLDHAEIGTRLGMEGEEIERLLITGGALNWAGDDFTAAWNPTDIRDPENQR